MGRCSFFPSLFSLGFLGGFFDYPGTTIFVVALVVYAFPPGLIFPFSVPPWPTLTAVPTA